MGWVLGGYKADIAALAQSTNNVGGACNAAACLSSMAAHLNKLLELTLTPAQRLHKYSYS